MKLRSDLQGTSALVVYLIGPDSAGGVAAARKMSRPVVHANSECAPAIISGYLQHKIPVAVLCETEEERDAIYGEVLQGMTFRSPGDEDPFVGEPSRFHAYIPEFDCN